MRFREGAFSSQQELWEKGTVKHISPIQTRILNGQAFFLLLYPQGFCSATESLLLCSTQLLTLIQQSL